MDCDKIAYCYAAWIHSEPFDVSVTSGNTLRALGKHSEEVKAIHAKISAWKNNSHYASKGSLMRTAPLAVWISAIRSEQLLYQAVKADVEFMHPNELVIQAVWHYHLAIQYLLNNPNDRKRASVAFDMAY